MYTPIWLSRRHFCTLRLVFLFWKKLSQKALVMYSVLLLRISKREMSKLTIVQGDFWLIVSRSCACHSPRTVLAIASIFLYQLLLKCTNYQVSIWRVNCFTAILCSRKHETRQYSCIKLHSGSLALSIGSLFSRQNLDLIYTSWRLLGHSPVLRCHGQRLWV